MHLKTIRDLDLRNKKILLRVDLNVPINNGEVTDTTRIDSIKPTVDYLIEKGAQIIMCSHFGRPDGKKDPKYSLNQIVPACEKILMHNIKFIEDCVDVTIPEEKLVLLENTRFYAEEENNDPLFAKKLASHAEIFVMDAFGAAHRAHASTEGVTHYLPSYAGFLMEAEINALSPLLEKANINKPLTIIIGGAKIDTKIGILKHFVNVADNIIIGGALANTFLLAEGYDVGTSLVETDKTDVAQEILLEAQNTNCNILLPKDVIVADEISDKAIGIDIPVENVELNMNILDVGKKSLEKYVEIIQESQTIVMNGPLGLYEFPQFEAGTYVILQALAKSNATTIVGGGDSVDALNKFNIPHDQITHISTGGGAMIEFLEGKNLPGVKPLLVNN